MKVLPYNNYIRSDFCYNILFTVELYNELHSGKTYNDVLNSYKQNWKKGFIERGKALLTKLKIIE